MDIQAAYKIFGVSENATDDQIEAQFLTWIRQDNEYQSQPHTEKTFDMESISNAYNAIKAYREYGTEHYQEVDSFRDKLEHFLYYYKLHIVGVTILIVIIGSIIQLLVNNYQENERLANLPNEDLRILMYGDYFNDTIDSTLVSDIILDEFPEWERVTVNFSYTPSDINGPMDVSKIQKSAITLIDDNSDLYITDYLNFDLLMKDEMFQPLEQIEEYLKGIVGSDKLIYGKDSKDGMQKLYGIVIDDAPIFNGIQVNNDRKIVSIRINAENKDNALKMILELIHKE